MNISRQKGFTLIETLVAITILMIAITGPFSIATKAFTAALDARNQTIASSLAQEGMEYINNIKDNNGTGSWPADNFVTCVDTATCGIGLDPNIIADPDHQIVANPCSNASMNNCALSLRDTLGYIYSSNPADPTTPFTRKFYMTPVGADGKFYMATVFVTWSTGSLSDQVTLNQLLSKEPR